MDTRMKLVKLFTIVSGSLMVPDVVTDEELQDLWDTNLKDLEGKLRGDGMLDMNECQTLGECLDYILSEMDNFITEGFGEKEEA